MSKNTESEVLPWGISGHTPYLFMIDKTSEIAKIMGRSNSDVSYRRHYLKANNPEYAKKLMSETALEKAKKVIEFYEIFRKGDIIPSKYTKNVEELSEFSTEEKDEPKKGNNVKIPFETVIEIPTTPETITLSYKGHEFELPRNVVRIHVTEDRIMYNER